MSTYRLLGRNWPKPAFFSLLVETVLALASVWLAYRIRFWDGPAFFDSRLWARASIFTGVVLCSLYLNGLYDFADRISVRRLAVRLPRAFSVATVVLMVIYYVTYSSVTLGRGVLAVAIVLALFLVTAWRLLLRWIMRRSAFHERILIVGSDELARSIAVEVLARDHLGYRVAGFVDDDPRLQGVSLVNPRVIGRLDSIRELAAQHRVRRIVVGMEDQRGRLDVDALLQCKTVGIPVERGTDFYERLTGRVRTQGLRTSSLVFSDGFVVARPLRMLKRGVDILLACLGLTVASPLMALIAIASKLESPHDPVFFFQERVGRHGNLFTVWKFRTMRPNSEVESGPRWASVGDDRVTRLGRVLRRYRLDELPQLWNVLRGDMSLVGPRPERDVFVRELTEASSLYAQRHVVRPGLTGWAQIMGGYAASHEESLEKLEFDLYYIRNLSLFLDFSILASTARTLLLGRGAR